MTQAMTECKRADAANRHIPGQMLFASAVDRDIISRGWPSTTRLCDRRAMGYLLFAPDARAIPGDTVIDAIRTHMTTRETAMPLGPEDLFARLEALGIETRTVTHPPLFTVAESQALRGELPGGHTKNLFVKDKKGRIFLIVAKEDAEVDLKKVHTVIGAQGRVSFGKPELLMEVLGVIPGAVTPLALINDEAGGRVTLILDDRLTAFDMLNFHPLDNTRTTAIARDDFLRFAEAIGHPPQIMALPEPVAGA